MCGGGYSGPSAAEQKAQEEAARSRAQAEADKLKAAQELERQKSGQAALADQVAMANADQARRTRNRTLLAGLSAEEDNPLESPKSPGEQKRKRATLLAVGGGA